MALSQLRALLMLGSSIRSKLPELYQVAGPGSSVEWHQFIERFASELSREIRDLKDYTDALHIWEKFDNSLFLKGASSPVRRISHQIGEEILSYLATGTDPILYAQRANIQAHAWISSMLEAYDAKDLIPPSPAEITVDADFAGQKTCAASSSMIIGNITWFFQYGPHALWGVLAIESVFKPALFMVPPRRGPEGGFRPKWRRRLSRPSASDGKPRHLSPRSRLGERPSGAGRTTCGPREHIPAFASVGAMKKAFFLPVEEFRN
jgi:hypothetical protein